MPAGRRSAVSARWGTVRVTHSRPPPGGARPALERIDAAPGEPADQVVDAPPGRLAEMAGHCGGGFLPRIVSRLALEPPPPPGLHHPGHSRDPGVEARRGRLLARSQDRSLQELQRDVVVAAAGPGLIEIGE